VCVQVCLVECVFVCVMPPYMTVRVKGRVTRRSDLRVIVAGVYVCVCRCAWLCVCVCVCVCVYCLPIRRFV